MLTIRGIYKCVAMQKRHISALYITGDKANENYVTLQPYLAFAATFADRATLEESIRRRGLGIKLEEVFEKYKKYKAHHDRLETLHAERESISTQIKTLSKSGSAAAQLDTLKESGKALRNEVKALKQTLYPIEDDFIHDFLHLPNRLHKFCPDAGQEKVLYRQNLPSYAKTAPSHLESQYLIRFVNNNCYYMMDQAAHFDVNAMHALTRYFVTKADFLQTANPDFVRCVLLEANATPLTDYHMVKEEQLLNKLNVAYLTGGASFESYLGAMTKLSVYPSVLPLRLISCGRSYSMAEARLHGPVANLYTATQSNAVQSFVATQTAAEADEQLDQILNLAVDFYKALNVPFRIAYTAADSLTPAESLRASIEVYAPSLQRYICVGRISNYGDFVSKRILFNTRREKHYDFLHIVGGPVLYTTRLIAALIEHCIPLDACKLLGSVAKETAHAKAATQQQRDMQEFRDLFK